MSDIPFPFVTCFLTDVEFAEVNEGHIAELQEFYEAQDDYDFNRADYTFIQEGTEAEMGGWDTAVPYTYRIVQRISDGRYFKFREHVESWNYTYPGLGEYGSIDEVAPTTKIVYEPV